MRKPTEKDIHHFKGSLYDYGPRLQALADAKVGDAITLEFTDIRHMTKTGGEAGRITFLARNTGETRVFDRSMPFEKPAGRWFITFTRTH